MPDAYIVVDDDTNLGTFENWIGTELTNRGYTPVYESDNDASLAAANAAAVLIVASTSSGGLGTKLRGTSTPFVCGSFITDEMGVAGAVTTASAKTDMRVLSASDSDPVMQAAGISTNDSPIQIFDSAQDFPVSASLNTTNYVGLVDEPGTSGEVFGYYPAGSAMVVGNAPNPGGCFLLTHDKNWHLMNANGMALWDAMLDVIAPVIAPTGIPVKVRVGGAWVTGRKYVRKNGAWV